MADALVQRKDLGISFLEGGRGDPFLLLHGIPGSGLAWRAVGELLADEYRVVLPDLAGFGGSDPPRGDYYMEAQARSVGLLLDYLGIEELYLGGHDFGGPVALTLTRVRPDLRLKGLVLSATNVFTDTHVPLPLRVARVPVLGTAFFRAAMGSVAGMRMTHLVAVADKDELPWEEFRRHLTPSSLDLTRRIFQRSLADLRTNYRAVEDSLARLTMPTLVLWGNEDPFFGPPVGNRTHKAIRGSLLKTYEGAGHFVPEEKSDLVAGDILGYFSE